MARITSKDTPSDPDPFAVRLEDFLDEDAIASPFFPGVYALFDRHGDPLYIGQSGNVPQRLRQHRKKKWFSKVVCKKVLRLSDAEDRLIAETLLQLRHRPRHCRAIKIGIRATGEIYEMQFVRNA